MKSFFNDFPVKHLRSKYPASLFITPIRFSQSNTTDQDLITDKCYLDGEEQENLTQREEQRLLDGDLK